MEIGVDIANICDFSGKDERFYRFFLKENEYEKFSSFKSKKRKAEFAAARWACKEAIFKATQDKNYLFYRIDNDESGKPFVIDHPELKVSISHHGEYAVATVLKTELGVPMLNENEVKEALKNFISETLGIEKELLKDDVLLFGDGEIGLGSIDGLEIIAFADGEYGVDMTGIPRENFATINSIVAYIVGHKE